MRETETEDERERQRGEKNREGGREEEGWPQETQKPQNEKKIPLCLSVTLYRYTNMNPNIWAHRIYSAGKTGGGARGGRAGGRGGGVVNSTDFNMHLKFIQ